MDRSNGADEENIQLANGESAINCQVAPDGPFKIQVQFGVRSRTEDHDGTYEAGYAKVVLTPGRIPTEEILTEAAIMAMGQLDEKGYRFMTRQEFADMIARERTGCEEATIPMGNLTFKLDVFP